jgi:hypothetical protein
LARTTRRAARRAPLAGTSPPPRPLAALTARPAASRTSPRLPRARPATTCALPAATTRAAGCRALALARAALLVNSSPRPARWGVLRVLLAATSRPRSPLHVPRAQQGSTRTVPAPWVARRATPTALPAKITVDAAAASAARARPATLAAQRLLLGRTAAPSAFRGSTTRLRSRRRARTARLGSLSLLSDRRRARLATIRVLLATTTAAAGAPRLGCVKPATRVGPRPAQAPGGAPTAPAANSRPALVSWDAVPAQSTLTSRMPAPPDGSPATTRAPWASTTRRVVAPALAPATPARPVNSSRFQHQLP